MNKLDILSDIKRAAEENGGRVIGWRKFESQTGIRQSDWRKYWARWSDAVREAGFVPNERTRAYGDSALLEKYAGLVRELGRVPASGDLRLKASNDAEFPHEKPFRRLGRQSDVVGKVLEYCHSHTGYEDVARLCGEYLGRIRNVADEDGGPQAKIGSVYLIRSGRFYKIGKTNAAGRREYELSIQLPEPVKRIHVIRTDDPAGIEAYWHNRFATKRKNGEWFELDAADVAAFKRRKFM